jgi:hypothetical protein
MWDFWAPNVCRCKMTTVVATGQAETRTLRKCRVFHCEMLNGEVRMYRTANGISLVKAQLRTGLYGIPDWKPRLEQATI